MALGLYEVIQYEGDQIATKHPVEDFNTFSVLYVHESQVAFKYDDGILSEPIYAGRHELDNNNIPFIKGFLSYLGNGASPYHCAVYFVDASSLIWGKWGFRNLRTRVYSPVYDRLPVILGLSGSISYRVVDPRTFITKLLLSRGREFLYKEDFLNEMNDIAAPILRARFDRIVEDLGINACDVYASLPDISRAILGVISPIYNEFGVEITDLSADSVDEASAFPDQGKKEVREEYQIIKR